MGSYEREKKCAIAMVRAISEIQSSRFGTQRLRVVPQKPAEGKQAISDIEQASQEAALQQLYRHFPEDCVLANKETPSLRLFARNKDSPRCWVLDALDGEMAYAEGRHEFGATIGLQQAGKFVVSVLCAPKLDIVYTAAPEGLREYTKRNVQAREVRLEHDGTPKPGDTIFFGSRVSPGLIAELNKTSLVLHHPHTIPTMHRALRVLEGTVKAYIMNESDIYDAGPVSHAIEAADGVFIDLQRKPPRWLPMIRQGRTRICLAGYGILGPREYCNTLVDIVNQSLDNLEEE